MENLEQVSTGRPQASVIEIDDRPRLSPVRGAVLVVEDDPSSRELLIELLASWGHSPLAVGSAEEASVAVRHQAISAAIVDVFLPGRSGASLFSRLRERFPDAVLIGTSALSDATMARRCKGLGADLFLPKPVRSEQLAAALKTPHRSWH